MVHSNDVKAFNLCKNEMRSVYMSHVQNASLQHLMGFVQRRTDDAWESDFVWVCVFVIACAWEVLCRGVRSVCVC